MMRRDGEAIDICWVGVGDGVGLEVLLGLGNIVNVESYGMLAEFVLTMARELSRLWVLGPWKKVGWCSDVWRGMSFRWNRARARLHMPDTEGRHTK